MHPIVDKARRALMYLQSSGGGDESLPNYYILNDAPEWVKDLCCDAHEDSLPNNHIYHMIYNVLNVIVEEGSLKPEGIRRASPMALAVDFLVGWDAAIGR